MARKPKSVYTKIEETKSEIILTEQTLVKLKKQLEDLLKEKDDLEMRQTWDAIKYAGLTMTDIKMFLEKQNTK